MSKEFTLPEGWGRQPQREDGCYESPGVTNDEANVQALELLRAFDGLPASVIRQVLRQAEFWLNAVTVLDCGESTEFARAVEGWTRAAEKCR